MSPSVLVLGPGSHSLDIGDYDGDDFYLTLLFDTGHRLFTGVRIWVYEAHRTVVRILGTMIDENVFWGATAWMSRFRRAGLYQIQERMEYAMHFVGKYTSHEWLLRVYFVTEFYAVGNWYSLILLNYNRKYMVHKYVV